MCLSYHCWLHDATNAYNYLIAMDSCSDHIGCFVTRDATMHQYIAIS